MNKSATARPGRRWLRFSLRSLLVATAVCGALLGMWAVPSERQRWAVEVIGKRSSRVTYDDAILGVDWLPTEWIDGSVGIDYLASVREVQIYGASDADLAAIGEVGSLRTLLLYLQLPGDTGPPMSDTGLTHLRELPRLEELTLWKVSIGDAALEHVGALPRLQSLTIKHTNITDAGLAHLRGMPTLRRLVLQGPFGDGGLMHVGSLTGLEELELQDAAVTDAGLSHLAGMRGLERLFFHRTAITDAGVAQLKAALPDCHIKIIE